MTFLRCIMKQKAVFILFLLILGGCGATDTSVSTAAADTTDMVLVVPAAETSAEMINDTYVLNTNTKKIHECTCFAVDMIKAENKSAFAGDFDTLLAQGYTLCKRCMGR